MTVTFEGDADNAKSNQHAGYPSKLPLRLGKVEANGLLQLAIDSPLRPIWHHSVTCHPAEVTFPPLPQTQMYRPSDRRAATHAGLVALINEESKTTYATPPWIVAHRSREGTDRHVVGGVA